MYDYPIFSSIIKISYQSVSLITFPVLRCRQTYFLILLVKQMSHGEDRYSLPVSSQNNAKYALMIFEQEIYGIFRYIITTYYSLMLGALGATDAK